MLETAHIKNCLKSWVKNSTIVKKWSQKQSKMAKRWSNMHKITENSMIWRKKKKWIFFPILHCVGMIMVSTVAISYRDKLFISFVIPKWDLSLFLMGRKPFSAFVINAFALKLSILKQWILRHANYPSIKKDLFFRKIPLQLKTF